MSFSEPRPSRPSKLLIITSSGGGGLIQAAVAKEQEALAQDPTLLVVKRDVLRDWVGKLFGKLCISFWNGAQRTGRIWMQVFGLRMQWLFDIVSWPSVFLHTLTTLYKEDVDRVIDTQIMCTSAILKAIRVFNQHKNKRVCLEKVVVDLPTKKATHYFRAIKSLSKKDKKILKLTTIAPLLDDGQTAEQFWQENCGLSESEINYEEVNVRQSFRKFMGKPRAGEPIHLKIRFKNEEELQLIRKALSKGSIIYQASGDEVSFTISPEDRVFTILLGSQPANEATLNYVKKFIQIAKESDTAKTPTHLFVFCADHQIKEQTLFRKVSDFIGRVKGYPKHLSIIPFSFQSEDVIAPLFHRSNLTCTRSGGQTSMELMAVSSGEMWVHSEAKKDEGEMTLEELLSGIPGWEAASALYLQKIRGAKIVTPEIVAPHARRLLRSGSGQASPMRDLESTA